MQPPNTPMEASCAVRGGVGAVIDYLDNSYTAGPMAGFVDLSWDMDLTMEEVLAYEMGVDVGRERSTRRVVAQRVRGEIRYWISTERDPMRMDVAEMELGTVESVAVLAELCREFLSTDTPPGLLRCPRRVRG